MAPIYFIDWPNDEASPLQMACVDFTVATFDYADFEREGIDRPPQIANAVPKRLCEFLHGRRCARAAMATLLPSDALSQLGIGDHRAARWPSGIIGSISHTSAMAAAMALPACLAHHGIGLDIENVLDVAGTAAVHKIVATAAELDLLAPLAAEYSTELALTLLFSAKESFFKATHKDIGHYFDFDAISLEWLDPATRRMGMIVRETLGAQWLGGARCQVRYLFLSPKLVATLCLTPFPL